MSADSVGAGRVPGQAALLSIPSAAALQIITREIWQATAPGGTLSSEPGPGPLPPGPTQDPPLAKGN
jgi:hypothetical protein